MLTGSGHCKFSGNIAGCGLRKSRTGDANFIIRQHHKESQVLPTVLFLLQVFKQVFCCRTCSEKSTNRGGGGDVSGGKRESGSWQPGPRGDVQHLTGHPPGSIRILTAVLINSLSVKRGAKTKTSAILSSAQPDRPVLLHMYISMPPSDQKLTPVRHTQAVHISKLGSLRLWAKKAYFSAALARASLLAWARDLTSPCLPFCLS